jgi:uracil-DNA glycosylase
MASFAPPVAPAATPAAKAPVDLWTAPADLITQPADAALTTIHEAIAACQRCGLCEGRTHTVPGEGNPQPELVFVGEGPGRDEDLAGRPFVGAAGELLDRMIVAMGLQRSETFICNVVKCRPPGNRNPEPDEMAACHPFLMAQLSVLRPKVICTLGNIPLRALFGAEVPGITRSRGKRMEWQGIPVYPTFHPSYLLRNDSAKKPAWEDLKAVLAELGRTPPARK